jgi:ABC-type amino acid transport substrate-binding protein
LADAIDALFAKWRDDGTLQGLSEKWFGASIDWAKAQ